MPLLGVDFIQNLQLPLGMLYLFIFSFSSLGNFGHFNFSRKSQNWFGFDSVWAPVAVPQGQTVESTWESPQGFLYICFSFHLISLTAYFGHMEFYFPIITSRYL